MAELQSRTSLVKASAMRATNHSLGIINSECSARTCSEFPISAIPLVCEEREAKVEGVDVVAKISAELQRERQKNAELMERISVLESQIQGKEKALQLRVEQDGCHNAINRSFKKFKRQKVEVGNEEVKDPQVANNIDATNQTRIHISCMAMESNKQPVRVVNWMSMDDNQFLNIDTFKEGVSALYCGDTDDSNGDECYDEDDTDIDDRDRDEDDDPQAADASKTHVMSHEGTDDGLQDLEISPVGPNETKNEGHLLPDSRICQDTGQKHNVKEIKKSSRKERRRLTRQKASSEVHSSSQEIGPKGSGNLLMQTKPPKMPFCPKEVRRIIESKVLQLKNAQSHTIRKIIVFASLGIRHGCEDMYELDFGHFRIINKGEPHVSPMEPGEHVLYEHPGVRRKVFYPNQQNPILCPVNILEEEMAMRPSDSSCPSCLFLCIKYGGRTRNLPQNEYVRQRMGRNKLKSFGPLMCQMATLVHIRSGSFFFKALGITLLFMAGFPDDLVQKETKYRNLDLLQKYYRTDEEAEGEELFCPYPIAFDTMSPSSQQLSTKAASTAPRPYGRRQAPLISKSPNLPKPTTTPSVSSISVPPTQFGLMGYASFHPQSMTGFQHSQSHTQSDISPVSNASIPKGSSNISTPMGQSPPPPYPMFPPYPMNTVVPVPYWHHTNAYPPCPYPSSYGYRSFPHSVNYLPHPYYNHPSCYPFMPKAIENTRKKDAASEVAGSDSDSSSCGMNRKIVINEL